MVVIRGVWGCRLCIQGFKKSSRTLFDDQSLQSERSLSGFQSLSALARGGDDGLEAVGSSESLLQERALMGKSGKQLFSVWEDRIIRLKNKSTDQEPMKCFGVFYIAVLDPEDSRAFIHCSNEGIGAKVEQARDGNVFLHYNNMLGRGYG
jgi:hypothetical protein